jgi:ribose transport system permease protein
MSLETDATPAAAPTPTPAAARRARLAGLGRIEGIWIALILLLLIAVFAIIAPSGTFLTWDNATAVLLDASELLILACGTTFLLIAAGLDLSIGAVVVFCDIICAKLLASISGTTAQADAGHYPHLAIAIVVGSLAALGVGALWGTINGFVIVKMKVPPFIATLGTAGIALGAAQVLSDGSDVGGVPVPLQESFGLGKIFGAVPWPVIVAVVVVVISWVILARTRFGMRTKAIGASEEAARRSGIRTGPHVIVLYAAMGMLAGLVSIIDVSRFGTASIGGHTGDVLAAIAAVVIGGTSLFGGRGSISGSVIGVFIPAVLINGFVIVGVQPFWQNIAVGLILIGAVYADQLRRRGANRA